MNIKTINKIITLNVKVFCTAVICSLLLYNTAFSQKKTVKEEPKTIGISPADELFFNGLKAMLLGDNNKMYDNFTKFVKLNPELAVGHYLLANYWTSEGNFSKAKKEIVLAEKLDPNNIWYKERKAYILAMNGEIRKSAETFGEVAGMSKHPRKFLETQIMLYERVGEINKALKILDTLQVYADEEDELIIYSRYQYYLNQNKIDSAIVHLKKLVELDPYNESFSLGLAELYLKEKKDTASAMSIYHKGLERFPANKAYHITLIRHYRITGDTIKMYEQFDNVINSKHLKAEDKISLIYPIINFDSKDTAAFFESKGFLLTKQLAERKPEEFITKVFYADLLNEYNKQDEALIEYKKSIKIDSSNISPYQQIISLYLRQENYDSLIHYTSITTKKFPEELAPYYFQGIGYQQQKQYAKAIESWNRALELENKANYALRSAIYSSLGDIYYEEKKYSISDSCYEMALDTDASNASALNNYAYYLSKRNKDIEKAERMSSKSLKIQPEEPSFLDTYGWIKYKQGEYQIAKAYITKAIELSKDDVSAVLIEHLGDIEYKLGNKTKAMELWKQALEKDGGSSLLPQKVNENRLYEED